MLVMLFFLRRRVLPTIISPLTLSFPELVPNSLVPETRVTYLLFLLFYFFSLSLRVSESLTTSTVQGALC